VRLNGFGYRNNAGNGRDDRKYCRDAPAYDACDYTGGFGINALHGKPLSLDLHSASDVSGWAQPNDASTLKIGMLVQEFKFLLPLVGKLTSGRLASKPPIKLTKIILAAILCGSFR
jgi:hypothetical protein